MEKKFCSYMTAVKWCHNNIIQLGNLSELDPYFYEDAWDDTLEATEIFTEFLTDYSDDDVRFLKEHFPDLLIYYSNKLEHYVLLVDHYGTGWDYVPTTVVGDVRIDEKELARFNH